jgi:hypothetical protein
MIPVSNYQIKPRETEFSQKRIQHSFENVGFSRFSHFDTPKLEILGQIFDLERWLWLFSNLFNPEL